MPIDVADHLGQAVLLIAFTMDNISSQAMLREAERVAAAHPEDLAVIGIAGENLPPGPHLEMLRVFRQVVGLQRVELARPDLEVREGTSALGVIERVPVAYLVNRAGRLSRRVDGLQSRQQLEELVAPALPSR